MSLIKARRQMNGFLVMRNRLSGLLHHLTGYACVILGHGIFWVQIKSAYKTLIGRLEIAIVKQGYPLGQRVKFLTAGLSVHRLQNGLKSLPTQVDETFLRAQQQCTFPLVEPSMTRTAKFKPMV